MAAHNLYKLDMLILHILSRHDCYGYEITQIINKYSNNTINTRVSSLYPILYRMIEHGYITDYEKIIKQKRKRAYYHLEPEGYEELNKIFMDYHALVAVIQSVLDYDGILLQKGENS